MRKLLLIGGLLITALPSLALAQPVPEGCYRRDNSTAGTIIGGVAGALVGSQVAGRGDRTAGAVIGGVGGAVIGNQVAGSSIRCPDGYYSQNAPPPAPAQYAAPPPTAYGQDRGYDRDDRRGDDRRGSDFDRNDGRFDGRFDRGTYWRDAPQTVRERTEWLDRRIERGIDNGSIDRREARRSTEALRQIRFDEQRMRRRGRLSPRDNDMLQARLDQVAQEIRWARRN